jgi:hypothetical protein
LARFRISIGFLSAKAGNALKYATQIYVPPILAEFEQILFFATCAHKYNLRKTAPKNHVNP